MVYFDFDKVLEASSIDSSYSSCEMNLIFFPLLLLHKSSWPVCGSRDRDTGAQTSGSKGKSWESPFFLDPLGPRETNGSYRARGPLVPALPTLAAIL